MSMDIDLIDVMLIIIASTMLGALIAVLIGMVSTARQNRRARKMQPLLGVVLPKEKNK